MNTSINAIFQWEGVHYICKYFANKLILHRPIILFYFFFAKIFQNKNNFIYFHKIRIPIYNNYKIKGNRTLQNKVPLEDIECHSH